MKKGRDFFDKQTLRRTLENMRSDVSFLQPPPDGGWGWVVVAAAATHCLLVSGFHSAFGVYMMPLLDTFESSNSQIAWIGSVSYALVMMFGPVSGKLLIKYGAIKVTIIGDLMTIGGLLWSSYADKLKTFFFTRGIIVGVGSSLAYTPGIIMVSLYFTKKRSLATGLVMAGGASGTFIQNKLQHVLIQQLKWRGSLRAYSAMLAICVIAAFAYRPLQKHRTHPSVVEKFNTSPLRGFIVDLGLWKDRIFEIWVGSLGLAKFGFYIPFVHMMKLADDLGIPTEKASYIMVGLGVSSMISCLLFGKICDIKSVDRLYVNQTSILCVGVVYSIIPYCTSFTALVVVCSFLGFFDAGNYVLLPILTFDLVGEERMPVAWGFMMAVNAISCFGPPFAGLMYDTYGNYTIGFVVTGICNIAAAAILALIPSLQKSSVQATKNYINASVCVITNTIVPWQSPTISLGSVTSSFTKSMISPAASTSGHSKGFSMKSFKSILKSDTTSVKMTSEPRTSVATVEYMKAFPDQENDTGEGKSEFASVQSQTSISMTQDLPIPCKKEDVVVLHEYESDEEAEIATGVKPGQELTVPELFMKRERSDSKQLERFPHRRQDGVAFLDEYEGDDEEEAEIATGVKPGQELTVPELLMKRERSDSKQLERFPHRRQDGVVFLDEYEGDEEEAEIATRVKPGQELTVPELFMKRERSDSKQLERFPHRKQDGVAFLDEYEGDEEEAEIATGVKPGQELTVPELLMKRERSDSKQLEHFPHRKEDGVAFLDDFIGDEEEHLRYVPSASNKKEDELVVEDIEDNPYDD